VGGVDPQGALAGEKKRRGEQGRPAVTGGAGGRADGGDKRDENQEKDRRNEPPPETAQERSQRQQRTLRGKDRAKIRTVLAELHAAETGEARDLLIEFVKRTRHERLKGEALLALAWRGNRAALDFLRAKHGLESSHVALVAAACRAIGKVGDPATKPLLLARVTSKDGVVAAGALAGLVALDRKAVDLPALIAIGIENEHVVVRVEAARSLAVVKSANWRPPLLRLLDDPAPVVRVAACRALAERRDEASVPRLMKVQADDADAGVRSAAKAAMLAIDESLPED